MGYTTRRSRAAAAAFTALAMAGAVLMAIGTDRGRAEAAPTPYTLQGLATGRASGAGHIFARFDGIDGESRDADHDKWIDVLSVGWGASKPENGGTGRRRSDAVVEDIALKVPYSKASPKLAEGLLKGTVFPSLEIEFTQATGGQRQVYLRYEMKNVSIGSYATHGSGKKLPKDFLSVKFEEIKVTYTEYDDAGQSKGNVEFEWKVEAGER